MQRSAQTDAVIVGMGIAGLSAAVAALQRGARVTVLETAGADERGGNTRWSEAFFRMKTEGEVSNDFLTQFTSAGAEPDLVAALTSQAAETVAWLKTLGVRFSDRPTYMLTASTPRISPVGGGLALVDTLAAFAEAEGARIHYGSTARDLLQDADGRVTGVVATDADGRTRRFGGAVVLACGGFQGDAALQAQHFGPSAAFLRPVARGGAFNRGDGVRMALGAGAAPAGAYGEFHAEPLDARSHKSEAIVFAFPYGVLVDREGRRFLDEGAGPVDAIYEAVSRRISHLPGGVAHLITDRRLDDIPDWRRTVRSDQPPVTAASIPALARALGLDAAGLQATLDAFNAATRPGACDAHRLDGLATQGLEPPKSNWATPIDTPPFRAWPIVCGNCFTFGGVRTDAFGRVLDAEGRPLHGLYAVGEVAGLYTGRYVGSTSVLRGAVFGRAAGRHLAERAAARS